MKEKENKNYTINENGSIVVHNYCAPLPAKRERKFATPTSSVPWYWKKVRSNT